MRLASSKAEFGAFFYNMCSTTAARATCCTRCPACLARSSRGSRCRATQRCSHRRSTGEGIIRLDDVTKDPRYGKNAPRRGMPEGHLPVSSYLAVPGEGRSRGEVLGGLFFGHSQPGVFTDREETARRPRSPCKPRRPIGNARLYRSRAERTAKPPQAAERRDGAACTRSPLELSRAISADEACRIVVNGKSRQLIEAHAGAVMSARRVLHAKRTRTVVDGEHTVPRPGRARRSTMTDSITSRRSPTRRAPARSSGSAVGRRSRLPLAIRISIEAARSSRR